MPAPPAVAAPAPPAAAVPPPVASVPPPPSAVLAGPGGSGEVQPEAGDFAVATMPEADELVPVAEAVSEVPFDSDGTWASSGRGSMSKRSMSKRSLSMPSLSLGEGRSRVVIAIVVVIALALAALAYLFLRPGSGNTAVAMTMSFTKSERQTYHMTMDLHGSLTAAGQQVPLSEQMDMVMTWKVTDVNAAGVATVDVGVRHATATVDGRKVKVPSLGHLRFQINQNGQIVSGNMMALTSASGSAGSGVPGTDQLTPLLPDHPVKPGDSWSKTYSQPNPFGDGSITYTTETHYVSNQMMQGVNAAVLQSTTTVPLNMTIDVRKMLKSAGSDATGSLDGADPKFTYKGSVTMNQTAWFDVPNKQMLATQVQGHFDLHMSVSGLPAGESFPGGEIGFTGDLTMSLTRTSGSGSASPSPDAGSSGSAT
ncbi:MAG TPA: hypothetical protein VGH10_13690 [Actinomycetota bacterium]|jgi:hypothetical protein